MDIELGNSKRITMNAIQFRENLLDIQGNLRRYALKLTRDVNDADDLIQDTTLRALKNVDKYVENANFKGWMMTIMYNIYLNNRDRLDRQRRLIDSNVDIANVPVSVSGGYSTPDGSYNIKEIYGAVNRLSGHIRVPFSMYLSGYKYAEIAEHLDIPIGTVKSRIFFARKVLQQELKEMR